MGGGVMSPIINKGIPLSSIWQSQVLCYMIQKKILPVNHMDQDNADRSIDKNSTGEK